MTGEEDIRLDCYASEASVWVAGRAYSDGGCFLFCSEAYVRAPGWFERRRGVTFEAKVRRACSRVRQSLARRMAGHRRWQAQAERKLAAARAAARAAMASMEELEGGRERSNDS